MFLIFFLIYNYFKNIIYRSTFRRTTCTCVLCVLLNFLNPDIILLPPVGLLIHFAMVPMMFVVTYILIPLVKITVPS